MNLLLCNLFNTYMKFPFYLRLKCLKMWAKEIISSNESTVFYYSKQRIIRLLESFFLSLVDCSEKSHLKTKALLKNIGFLLIRFKRYRDLSRIQTHFSDWIFMFLLHCSILVFVKFLQILLPHDSKSSSNEIKSDSLAKKLPYRSNIKVLLSSLYFTRN